MTASVVLGIYGLTYTIVFTNIALPQSNHLYIVLKLKINNISISMAPSQTHQEILNVSELVSLKKMSNFNMK